MTKEKLIEKYFKKPDLFGNRQCKYNKILDIKPRINKKGQLQWRNLDFIVVDISWKDFYELLKDEKEYRKYFKKKNKDDNDINNFDWSVL